MSEPSPATETPLLTDRRERALRDLRISVTDRCNFRCPYCMPAEIFGDRYEFLPKQAILSFEEIERLTRIFLGLGVRKIRITGGEPLVRAQLPDLVRRLASLEGARDLALTTNGFLLADLAEPLEKAGLRRVTVSLDSLDEAVFARMNGRGLSLERVLAGIEAAERAGLAPIKLNCVVQRGVNEDSLVALVRRFRGTGHVVRFIEFMDVGTLNRWDMTQVVPAAEIRDRIAAEFPLVPLEPNYRGEVARRYGFADSSGEIGIIASVTQPFCGDCTRARLSADGRLVTCLFASTGTDLKTPLRAGASDAEIAQIAARVWGGRSDRYSEERAENTSGRAKIQMYQIGG
ncbi:MAG: GTP 3',8-cyclase MoaA [Deltaproteobacteria bacterium]|nr:GTP 3',8-cyclase MoaA [Deltaproteobacteria bacterium]